MWWRGVEVMGASSDDVIELSSLADIIVLLPYEFPLLVSEVSGYK